MSEIPKSVRNFLQGENFVVAGVSRNGDVAANAIFHKLKDAAFNVYPVNPNADEVEGIKCYPEIASVPDKIHGVVIGTHPEISADIVRQCADAGIQHIWFHRSFGTGSVSEEAITECKKYGIDPVIGGCPLMFIDPVDVVHTCMRWWLQKNGRVPV